MGAIATERRTAPARQLTLAERVNAHMEAWPGNEFGGWIVAEDHRHFVPRAEKRRREIKQGWTIRPVTQTEFSATTVQCFYGTCDHHPADAVARSKEQQT